MTFAEIKAEVKARCNLQSGEADTRIGNAINRHYRRLSSLIGMDVVRAVTRPATMSVGVRTVTFNNIEKIDYIFDVTSTRRKVDEASLSTLRTAALRTAEPSQWATQNTAATSVTITTDTQPQTAYQLQAEGWASVADLAADDEPAFAASFHDILTWYVLAEEYLRKEKTDLADRYEAKAIDLQERLVFHYADSPDRDMRQAGQPSTASLSASGGSGATGATSFTQSGLVTFDRGAGIAPYAVAQPDAAVVTNLDADKLDGEEGSFYRDVSNLNACASDKLLGRDTAGTGEVEQIDVSGGLEFTSGGAIRRGAITGDISIAAGASTASMTSTLFSKLWPVGSIYTSVVATNPGTLMGFGTWTAFGAGRVLVGLDATQTEFDTVEETGGAKTHTLTTPEIPSHSHGVTDPGHTHTVSVEATTGTLGTVGVQGGDSSANSGNPNKVNSNTTGISIDLTGGSGAHNNLQPYIVVYMWKRTA